MPAYLDHLDASDCPLWRTHVGTVLESAEVLGERGTPHAVCLRFSTGTVLAGNGDGEHTPPFKLFGDTDHVIMLSRDEAISRGELTNLLPLWKSGSEVIQMVPTPRGDEG